MSESNYENLANAFATCKIENGLKMKEQQRKESYGERMFE